LKPFRPEQLITRLQAMLGGDQGEIAGERPSAGTLKEGRVMAL
jgi:DNA-binding response OmpR family regulator